MPYKSVVNPSFLVVMMEVQQDIQDGWYIDEQNYPTANITHYEVHLIRDEDVVSEAPKKRAGRPPRVKQ